MRCTLDGAFFQMHALDFRRRLFFYPDGAVSFVRCTLDNAVSFMLTFDALYS
jgi:hypothetical protein